MLEHITVKIWKFVRYINKKIKKGIIQKSGLPNLLVNRI